MNNLIENLELAFTDYGDKADTLISKCKEFQNDDSYTGERATVVKDLVGDKEVSLVNAQKDMQAKLLSMYKHAVDSFAEKVDSAPNARLDLETLDMVESDLKAIYRDVDTTCAEIEKIAKEMKAKYGHFGHITVPNADPLRESLENLCGGYNPEAGFYHDLKQKFINWDEEECAYIDSQLLDVEIEYANSCVAQVNDQIDNLKNNGKGFTNKKYEKIMDSTIYNYLIDKGFESEEISYLSKNYPGGLNSVYAAVYWNSGAEESIIMNLRIESLKYNYNFLYNELQERYHFSDIKAGKSLYDLYKCDEIEYLKTSYYSDTQIEFIKKLDSIIFSDNDLHKFISNYFITVPETVHGKKADGTDIVLNPRNDWGQIGYGNFPNCINKDSEGRYIVNVGPSILDPNYPDDGEILASDFDLPQYLDVYLKNKETDEPKIIHCVVEKGGKAHTFSHNYDCTLDVKNGYIQTGIPYPATEDFHKYMPGNMDASVIEFCGHALDFSDEDYVLEGIIVLEKED